MNIFDLPPIIEAIDNDIAAGLEPDPAKIALLVQEGPSAIESWIDMIDIAQGEADTIAARVKELQARKLAREAQVDRMKDCLATILDNHFDGKVKTAMVTTWTQESKSYEFPDEVIPVTYLIPQQPKVDKKQMITDLKAGTLPKTVTVNETTKSTLRVRR